MKEVVYAIYSLKENPVPSKNPKQHLLLIEISGHSKKYSLDDPMN